MTRDEAAELLRTDPKTLLRQAYLFIHGGAGIRSSRHHFLVLDGKRYNKTQIPGFTTGLRGLFGRKKDRPVFVVKLRRFAAPEEVAGSDDANTVYAHYVAMKQTSDTTGTHYVLPADGSPNLMITSRLSGCMFGVGSNANNNVLVSHFQPDQRLPEDQRRQDLLTATNTGYTGTPATFVRGGGYDVDASIVGIRQNGVWHIYAQRLDVVEGEEELEERIGGVTTLS